jgi:hypothetical protein
MKQFFELIRGVSSLPAIDKLDGKKTLLGACSLVVYFVSLKYPEIAGPIGQIAVYFGVPMASWGIFDKFAKFFLKK